jgi:hypothetical protein
LGGRVTPVLALTVAASVPLAVKLNACSATPPLFWGWRKFARTSTSCGHKRTSTRTPENLSAR